MTLDSIITKYERKAAEIPHLAAPNATDLDAPILAALLRELKTAREEVEAWRRHDEDGVSDFDEIDARIRSTDSARAASDAMEKT